MEVIIPVVAGILSAVVFFVLGTFIMYKTMDVPDKDKK
jgi:uncharacterized protein YneF (UPF0154 family)